MRHLFEKMLWSPLLVLIAIVGFISWGVVEYKKLPKDAFPDLSPVMVPVFAEGHGLSPEEVERLITTPIEARMNGLPGVERVKSTSAFGMAVVYVYFKDNVDIYFARSLVSQRLADAVADLPPMDEPPSLGPISTGLGEVFMYYLEIDSTAQVPVGMDPLAYVRSINDWQVKKQLASVPGVTEILSMGGQVLQYQVRLDPYKLERFGLGIPDVIETISENNHNVGGGFLVYGAEEFLLGGIGVLRDIEDLRNMPVKSVNGSTVLLSDLGDVVYGNEERRGVVTRDGKGEVVSGIVLKLYGENTSVVIAKLREKVAAVQENLPKGIRLVPYYDQNELVEKATGTVLSALFEGSALVVAILFLFLWNIRSAGIVALSLPISALAGAICMSLSGISANLMSFGGIAIAIGMLGDASIVVVENVYRRLGLLKEHSLKSRIKEILDATAEVARPILFSVLIIVLVFLPILTLEGVEGKMFKPLALTIVFSLIGSLFAAFIAAPVLARILLKEGGHSEPFFMKWLRTSYTRFLQKAVRYPVGIAIAAGVMLIWALSLVPKLGTEFIPALEEGAIQIGIAAAPSTGLDKMQEMMGKMERMAQEFPEVEWVVTRIGRPEAGSHPHPVNTASMQIALKPMNTWRYPDKPALVQALSNHLGQYPGVQLNLTQPIQHVFDELLSGVRTQLAVKVYGKDLDTLRQLADQIKESIEGVEGLVDLNAEQGFGQPQVQVHVDRERAARLGVTAHSVLEAVEIAGGGEVVSQLYGPTGRNGIQVRFAPEFRKDTAALSRIPVEGRDGIKVPLADVARIVEVLGPVQVNHEKGSRVWTVGANVRGRDMGSVVSDMKRQMREKVKLPPGYEFEIGGQFTNQERAMSKLQLIVPMVLVAIFLLLYLALGSIRSSALIFLNVPLALVGGLAGLWIFEQYLSVPAAVGFIALFGIAVQNGIMMVSIINTMVEEGSSIAHAVLEGASQRLRPVLMTAGATVLGLIPLLFATGIGSEVQKPLAIVVVCGLVTSTALTLVLMPVLYRWFAPKHHGIQTSLTEGAL